MQLLDAGWPILGDQTYSAKESRAASEALGLHRQFLHAVSLTFTDPTTATQQQVDAPLAADLQAVLDRLTPVSGTA